MAVSFGATVTYLNTFTVATFVMVALLISQWVKTNIIKMFAAKISITPFLAKRFSPTGIRNTSVNYCFASRIFAVRSHPITCPPWPYFIYLISHVFYL